MFNKRITIIIVVLFVLSLVGCSQEIHIVYSGAIHGSVKDCECPSLLKGGVARIGTFILKEFGGYDNEDLIKVDVGGFSDYDSLNNDGSTNIVMEAFEMMKYDVVNITSREMMFNESTILNKRGGGKVKMISANIYDLSTGERLFDSCLIRRHGEVEIMIIGIADNESGSAFDAKRDWIIADPIIELNRITKKSHADIVVVLTDIKYNKMAHLIEQICNVDYILAADEERATIKMEKYNAIGLSYITARGQSMGWLKLVNIDGEFRVNKCDIVYIDDEYQENEEIARMVRNALNNSNIRSSEEIAKRYR